MNKLVMNRWLALGLAMLSVVAYADQPHRVTGTKPSSQNAELANRRLPTKLGLNEGVVEEVDKENRSIIINHGHIKSKTVEMGPMTMPFSVTPALLLKAVKVGDRVKFNVENVNGMPTLTSLKVQR